MDEAHAVPADELAAEQAATILPKEEEIRAEIITEFGFDEETDKERIEKAVKREMDSREKLSKAIGQKRTWREQATKKPDAKPVDTTIEKKEDDLSSTDLYALMGAQVPQEDVPEVRKAAKLLGVSIPDALKDDMVKGILATRLELRTTANATNTSPARPGAKKQSDEALLEDASKGVIPEKGSPAAEDLFWARRGGKRK